MFPSAKLIGSAAVTALCDGRGGKKRRRSKKIEKEKDDGWNTTRMFECVTPLHFGSAAGCRDSLFLSLNIQSSSRGGYGWINIGATASATASSAGGSDAARRRKKEEREKADKRRKKEEKQLLHIFLLLNFLTSPPHRCYFCRPVLSLSPPHTHTHTHKPINNKTQLFNVVNVWDQYFRDPSA